MNRIYTMSYAYGDQGRDLVDGVPGDVRKFATHLESTAGETDVLKKVTITSLISNVLSPNIMAISSSVNDYINNGKLEVQPVVLQTRSGHGYSWDIPQYLNPNSLTISPTLYWLPNDDLKDALGASNLVIGAALEVPVIGDDANEARFTVDAKWDRLSLESGLSLGPDGQFVEINASYDLSDSAKISLGAAQKSGDTLRGTRGTASGKKQVCAGTSVTF